MLHRKFHIESHLQSAEKRLDARVELLTTNGVDEEAAYNKEKGEVSI